jgi:hypothetical protein
MVAHADVGYRRELRTKSWSDPGYQAFRVLHFGFAVLPTIAGVDKFTRLLSDWSGYLSPAFAAASPLSVQSTMYLVGLIEIAAGFLVAVVPRVGAYVVAAWLAAIIVNLLLLGAYWDVALRDFGLLLGAAALGRLSHRYKAL